MPSAIDNLINRVKFSGPAAWALGKLSVRSKARLRRMVDSSARPSVYTRILRQTAQSNDLLARLSYDQARLTGRFQDPQRLLGAGFKVYSQHDEDGIIEEIGRRIGLTDRFFVEFGIGDGLENCTAYQLLTGWSGFWIEAGAQSYEDAMANLDFLIRAKRLSIAHEYITAENINSIFSRNHVPTEFDFLSIDIDNNDFWIWKAIEQYSPRFVAIEYNASFGPTASCVVPYGPTSIWNGTNYFGASLKAIEVLGRHKGYNLVGCNYTGVTAFLVRSDLVGDRFAEPFTSENHYEPPRYFVRMPNGHPAGFGPVLQVGGGDEPGAELRFS